ncbi:MAG: HAD family phosphatase [Clostridia bacterium]|nr:HAD family phosphatase [Clostridia bacterium]
MKFIFDMDGTLIDSMDAFGGAMIRFLEDNNIEYPSDIVKIITPLGFKGSAEYFLTLGSKKSIPEMLTDFTAYMIEPYTKTIPEKEGVTETLLRLKKEGHSLNVLTASPHVTLDPCLKRLGLYDLFENVWSCDDFSMTKSEPEIYVEAAKRLGTTVSECIFIDDNVNAVKTAKKAGMHAWGIYDKSSDSYVDEMKEVSERYIYAFSEI